MDLFSLVEGALGDMKTDKPALSTGLDLDELDNILEGMSIDYSKTGYIICEKQNFRTESLFEGLKQDYKMQMICLTKEVVTEYSDVLFFIIDVTDFTSNKLITKVLSAIQSVAIQLTVPIFIIGEQEDINRLNPSLKRSEINIIEFERPVSIKRCLEDVESTLLNATKFKSKKHVLVVDDSITFLKLVQKILEKNYRVTAVPSAMDCIRTIVGSNDVPDLIIIDYMMPTCNGLTLCKMLREDSVTKDIPIIFLSGNSDVNEIIQVMPMIDGYVLKSQPITELNTYLEKIFETKDKEKKYREKQRRKV